jgi:hypothetical protein
MGSDPVARQFPCRKVASALVGSQHGQDRSFIAPEARASNEVTLMASKPVIRFVLPVAGALLMGACASQPEGSLSERYFQREASNYLKFQHEGRTVYCQTGPQAASLIPFDPNRRCISETALRQAVENYRRDRNPVQRGGPPDVASVPGGSGT